MNIKETKRKNLRKKKIMKVMKKMKILRKKVIKSIKNIKNQNLNHIKGKLILMNQKKKIENQRN